VYKVERYKGNESKTLIFGDSITYDTLKYYLIENEENVLNFTVNAASGFLGNYLIFKRYLDKNIAPKKILVISTPEFLNYLPNKIENTEEIYLKSVFQKDYEKKYISKIGYETDDSKFKFINFQNSVIDPIIALIKRPIINNKKKTISPFLIKSLEKEKITIDIVKDFEDRSNALTLSSNNKVLSEKSFQIMEDFCKLTSALNVNLYFIFAPIPEKIYNKWINSRIIENLKDQILSLNNTSCQNISVIDINSYHIYPNYAFRDSDHLKTPGWTAEFAREIYRIIKKLN